jgi:hypothetical protein
MTHGAAVLFVNEAFYAAFRERDFETMEGLWARRAPVACIHPGWQALDDREDIVESWQAILGNPDSPSIQCRNAEAFVLGEAAFVVCYEELGDSILYSSRRTAPGSWSTTRPARATPRPGSTRTRGPAPARCSEAPRRCPAGATGARAIGAL